MFKSIAHLVQKLLQFLNEGGGLISPPGLDRVKETFN